MQGGFFLGNLPAQHLVRHSIVSLELLDLHAAKGMIYVCTGIGHVAAAARTPACDRKWLGRPSIRLDARSWKRGSAGHKYARRFLLRQPPSSASGPPQHSVLGVAGLTRCKGHDICVHRNWTRRIALEWCAMSTIAAWLQLGCVIQQLATIDG